MSRVYPDGKSSRYVARRLGLPIKRCHVYPFSDHIALYLEAPLGEIQPDRIFSALEYMRRAGAYRRHVVIRIRTDAKAGWDDEAAWSAAIWRRMD